MILNQGGSPRVSKGASGKCNRTLADARVSAFFIIHNFQ